MVRIAENMVCDFCNEDIGIDETGIYCAAHTMGGHILCATTHFKEKH